MAKAAPARPQELKALGAKLGFGVDIVEPVANDGVVFSSSQVRDDLRKGQLEEPAVNGYWWRVRGTVERGAARGKGLGFPTANWRSRRVRTSPTASTPAGRA